MRLYYDNCGTQEYVNYDAKLNNKIDPTTVIFFHGMWSSTLSTKAQFIKRFCEEYNINYILFDYFGHGQSSGNFDDLTFEKALNSCFAVINELVIDKCIIVGSSFGCWLATHVALMRSDKVKGLILVAPAIDFTTFLLHGHQGFELDKNGDLLRYSETAGTLIIRKKYLDSAENYLLADGDKIINLDIPVCFLQGTADTSVPYELTIKLMEKFSCKQMETCLVKSGKHSFSTEFCLNIIKEKILSFYNRE